MAPLVNSLAKGRHPTTAQPETTMPAPTPLPTFPSVATAQQIRDYMEWLVQTGRGHYRIEIRERYIALPPTHDACDDQAHVAFLRGVV